MAIRTRFQVNRFLVVGCLTVLIDLLTYRVLAWLGLDVHLAKAIGFVTGTVFAYFANRIFTFEAQGGTSAFARFVALYVTTLACNVTANAAALAALPRNQFAVLVAFLLATALSAMLNFVGMKFLVFRDAAPEPRPDP